MFRFGIQKRKKASTILELIILRILLENKRIHGYELQKKIVRLLNRTWHPSFSLLYPLLNSMEKRGLIKRKSVMKGKRKIYEYEITPRGVEHYKRLIDMLKSRTYELVRNYNDDYSALPLIFFTTEIGSRFLLEFFPKEDIIEILSVLDRLIKLIDEKRTTILDKIGK